jgi:hypothetical protein
MTLAMTKGNQTWWLLTPLDAAAKLAVSSTKAIMTLSARAARLSLLYMWPGLAAAAAIVQRTPPFTARDFL